MRLHASAGWHVSVFLSFTWMCCSHKVAGAGAGIGAVLVLVLMLVLVSLVVLLWFLLCCVARMPLLSPRWEGVFCHSRVGSGQETRLFSFTSALYVHLIYLISMLCLLARLCRLPYSNVKKVVQPGVQTRREQPRHSTNNPFFCNIHTIAQSANLLIYKAQRTACSFCF